MLIIKCNEIQFKNVLIIILVFLGRILKCNLFLALMEFNIFFMICYFFIPILLVILLLHAKDINSLVL